MSRIAERFVSDIRFVESCTPTDVTKLATSFAILQIHNQELFEVQPHPPRGGTLSAGGPSTVLGILYSSSTDSS